MSNLIVYYAHPGHRHSKVNAAMVAAIASVEGLSFVDLYAEYPRFEIDIDREQQRLLQHDVIVFQFPMFWYSTPSLIKEWLDLVLEHGFAYGAGGDSLAGKHLVLAVSAAGPASAYRPDGYQRHPIRTFLTPLEQTAKLCHMNFVAPYVLYGSLQAPEQDLLEPHSQGYRSLLEALRDDNVDLRAASEREVITFADLPLPAGSEHG